MLSLVGSAQVTAEAVDSGALARQGLDRRPHLSLVDTTQEHLGTGFDEAPSARISDP